MKQFHAVCTRLCTQSQSNGLGGLGGKAALTTTLPRKVYCYRHTTVKDAIDCTILLIGEELDYDSYNCVIEVADEYEAKLLAEGMKPVVSDKPQIIVEPITKMPESNEQFVKRYYPGAWACPIAGAFSVRYSTFGCNDTGPNDLIWTIGCQCSYETAWAQAAKEVREYLSKQQPVSPQVIEKKPVETPKPTPLFLTDEEFVKLHYPDARVSQCGQVFSIRLSSKETDGKELYNRVWSLFQESPEKAWKQVAIEIREHLAKQATATTDVVKVTPKATIATLPDTTPTASKPMTMTTEIGNTQQSTQQNWIQRKRNEAKAMKDAEKGCTAVMAHILTVIFAVCVSAFVNNILKKDIPSIVLQGILTPFVGMVSMYLWTWVYIIATCDYVPQVRPAKTTKMPIVNTEVTTTPKLRNSFSHFLWWILSTASMLAIGYGVHWLQTNWTSVCFNLGMFLQQIAGQNGCSM